MKAIDIDTVKPFVRAAIYALDLAEQARAKDNQRAEKIELENAKRELYALLEKLETLEHLEP